MVMNVALELDSSPPGSTTSCMTLNKHLTSLSLMPSLVRRGYY